MTDFADFSITMTEADLKKFGEIQATLVKKQRDLDINLAISKLRTAGPKRNVAFIMRAKYKLDDLRALLPDDFDEDTIITEENTKEYGKKLSQLVDGIKELREFLNWEIDMQTQAATSPLGWKVVKQLESSENCDGSGSMTVEAIREAENKAMKRERELRTAKNFRHKEREDKSRSRGDNYRSKSRHYGEDSYRDRDHRREDGRDFYGRGRRYVKYPPGCLRCGSNDHKVADCRKEAKP